MFPINIIWKTPVASVSLLRSEQHVAQWQPLFVPTSPAFGAPNLGRHHRLMGMKKMFLPVQTFSDKLRAPAEIHLQLLPLCFSNIKLQMSPRSVLGTTTLPVVIVLQWGKTDWGLLKSVALD